MQNQFRDERNLFLRQGNSLISNGQPVTYQTFVFLKKLSGFLKQKAQNRNADFHLFFNLALLGNGLDCGVFRNAKVNKPK